MSFIQRVMKSFLSEEAAKDMEAHSRSWYLKCPRCGFEKSIWEMGGIRWKATGNSKNYMRCINCGERSWHQMYRKSVDTESAELSQS